MTKFKPEKRECFFFPLPYLPYSGGMNCPWYFSLLICMALPDEHNYPHSQRGSCTMKKTVARAIEHRDTIYSL